MRTTPFRPPALAAAALLICPLLAPPAASADDVPAARRLPPVTYGFVSVPDVETFKERYGETATSGIFDDPAFAELHGIVAEKFEEAGEELRSRLGVTLEELLEIPSGEVTFAVVQTAPRKVAVVGLLDYGTSADAVDALLEKAEDALEENGSTRSEEPFEGTDVVVWTAPEPDAEDFDEFDEDATEEDGDPRKFGYFLKDSHLVVASDPAALEAVLVRWDGTHSDTFADDEAFAYIADRTRTDDRAPALLWYANVYGSIRAAVSGTQQGGMAAQMALAYLPVVGLDQFKAVGGSMDLATEEYESVGKVVFYADRTDKALGLLKFSPTAVAPPGWVRADAGSYVMANWDLAGAYDASRELYDSIVGPGEFDLKVDQLSESGPGLNIKTDLIDRFSGKIEAVTYAPEGLAEAAAAQAAGDDVDAPAQPFVVSFGLTDPQGISELLSQGVDAARGQVETREFQGTTIYEADNPQNDQRFAVAVSGNSLLLSLDVTELEAVLRGAADEPLAETADFRKALAKLPGPVSIFSYSDAVSQSQTVYELFRSGALTGQMGDDEGGRTMAEIVDALPPFEDVKEYLTISASYMVPDEHGALWVSYGVKPAE